MANTLGRVNASGFKDSSAYSGFAVNDIAAANDFYAKRLGLDVREAHDQLELHLASGTKILIYPKSDHVPATFTILNFRVDSVNQAITELKQLGIAMEIYKGLTDERGVHRGDGPTIAWFKDPGRQHPVGARGRLNLRWIRGDTNHAS